jgi:hypothetical protein
MPAGANRKREREYQEMKDEFGTEHRYPGREEEVAARIVNKQRAVAGETRKDAAKKTGRAAKASKPAAPRKRSKASTRHTRHRGASHCGVARPSGGGVQRGACRTGGGAAAAALQMVVDQPHGLHEGVHRGRPDETEAAPLQVA